MINRFEANVFALARKDLSKIAARKHLGMTIMRDCKGNPFAIPFIFRHNIAIVMLWRVMDLKIIAVYCICDDVLNILNIKDNQQCLISSAEVMTVGIVSALFYGGNIVAAREFLKIGNYIPNILSHSRLHRRLLAIPQELWNAVFSILRETLHYLFPSTEFAVDSCPVLACQPCRSWRCKLYQGKQYLGYCAAKKLHYYGLNGRLAAILAVHGRVQGKLY